MKRLIFTCFVLLLARVLQAQVYPVQSNLQVTPPYSVNLPDYVAAGSDRMALNVILTDVSRAQLDVQLRFTIEGEGIRIETNPNYNPPPLSLVSGFNNRLIASDLAPYFNAQNLVFRGMSASQYVNSGGALPEGVYRFCFEVLEYNRGVKISNTTCVTAWLILNDPPLINLPAMAEKLDPSDPQFVRFQWTPRHTGSPNSAFSTEYDFELVEVWPKGRNPNDAILTTAPIFQATTIGTSLVYGPSEPPLVRGREYAFRVRAKSKTGIEQLDLFRNEGYSVVHSFTYGDECLPPKGFSIESVSSRKIQAYWENDGTHTGYKIRYRRRGDTDWIEEPVLFDDFTIEGLLPDTFYEVQVAGVCGFANSDLTGVESTKTQAEIISDFDCGAPPEEFNLENTTPLPSLKRGDVVYAGDFDIRIIEVNGGNGNFSGLGQVVMPMMNNVKMGMSFSGIKVNDEYRMYDGFMHFAGLTVQVLDDEMLDVINGVLGDIAGFEEDLNNILDFSVEVMDSVNAIVETIQNTEVFTEEEFTEVISAENDADDLKEAAKEAAEKAVQAVASGNIVEAAKQVAKSRSISKRAKQKATQAAHSDTVQVAAVEFVSGGQGMDSGPGHLAIEPGYYKISTNDGDKYGPWFSLRNGTTTTIVANWINSSQVPKEDITFLLGEEQVDALVTGKGWELGIAGGEPEGERLLKARYQGKTVGIAAVVTYKQENRNVVLVGINNADMPGADETAAYLNNTFGSAMVNWSVSSQSITIDEAWDLNGNNDLYLGENNDLSTYTDEAKAMIRQAKGELTVDDDKYYLLFTDASNSLGADGYMPRKKQFGFIFNNSKQTIAHELGHGAFRLPHTWEEFPSLSQGDTQNLMDYGGGTKLRKYQWEQIHDPKWVMSLFDDEEEGANYRAKGEFRNYGLPVNEDGTYTFVAPSGEFVTLPKDVFDVTFNFGISGGFATESDFVPGTLRSFSLYTYIEEEFGIFEMDFDGNPIARKFVLGDDGKYRNGTEEYANITPADSDLKGLYSLPFGGEIMFYHVETQLSHYTGESATPLSFDEFPIKDFCAGCKLKGFPIDKTLGGDQQDIKPGILEIIYTKAPSENLVYLAKVLELGNAFPRLFEEQVTPGMIMAENICQNVQPSEMGKLKERIASKFCDCRTATTGGQYPSTYLDCSEKEGDPVTLDLEYLQSLYNLFLEETEDYESDFRALVSDFDLDDQVFKTCEEALIISGINSINSDYIRENLGLNKIHALISRLVNEAKTRGSESDLTKDAEGAIVKLVKYSNKNIHRLLMEKLEGANYYDPNEFLFEQLFESVDDEANYVVFKSGAANRLELISLLTGMMLNTSEFYEERLEQAYSSLGERIFVLEFNNVWKDLGISALATYSVAQGGSATYYASEYVKKDISYDWLSDQREIKIQQRTEVGWYGVDEEKHTATLRPFDLVVFVNKNKLSKAQQLNHKLSDAPVPAIVAMYSKEAGTLETIDQSISAVIDVGSLAISGGTLATIKGISTVAKIKKSFAIADMASSGLSITAVAASNESENQELVQALEALSAIIGLYSLGDLAPIKAAGSMREAVTLSKNLAESFGDIPRQVDVDFAIKKINDLPEDALVEFVVEFKKEREVILGNAIDRVKYAAKADEPQAFEEAAKLVDKLGDLLASTTDLRKLFEEYPDVYRAIGNFTPEVRKLFAKDFYAANASFRAGISESSGLVDAWRKMFDLGDAIPDAIKRNPDILSKTQNWSDDLYSKLGTVKDRNPTFFDRVNDNPQILEFFEEGSSIIGNKSGNLKAVDLDMYALDRARPETERIFELGTTDYVTNTTRDNYADLHRVDNGSGTGGVNLQSGKIRDANGNVISTDNVNGEGLMYVIDEFDNIHIGGRGGANSYPHPTLIGGTNPNVKSAGMIRFKDGRILEVNRNSGHFKPSSEALQEAQRVFTVKFPQNSFDSNFRGFIDGL